MGFLSDIGLGFLDGGSSSSSVSSTVNLDIKGLDKIGVTETIDVKPVTVTETIDLKPVTLNETIDLKPVTVTETIDLRPVTLTETIDLRPVTLSESIDLKPVAVDTCQTLRLAPLPDTDVCQPYRHHVAYTMFGVEYWSITYDGESNQRIASPRHPQVVEHLAGGLRDRARPSSVAGRGIRVRIVDPGDED